MLNAYSPASANLGRASSDVERSSGAGLSNSVFVHSPDADAGDVIALSGDTEDGVKLPGARSAGPPEQPQL